MIQLGNTGSQALTILSDALLDRLVAHLMECGECGAASWHPWCATGLHHYSSWSKARDVAREVES